MEGRTPRLASHVWVAAHRRRVEIAGGSLHVVRRGAAESGAIAIKLVTLGLGWGAPSSRALTAAVLGDGRLGWSWLVGPELHEDAEVAEKLERQAAFDPDLWILEIEDREGRHFLDDPVV